MTDWRRLECECLLQPCPLAKASVNGAISRHKLTGNLSEKHVIELKKQEKKRRMGGGKNIQVAQKVGDYKYYYYNRQRKKKLQNFSFPSAQKINTQ